MKITFSLFIVLPLLKSVVANKGFANFTVSKFQDVEEGFLNEIEIYMDDFSRWTRFLVHKANTHLKLIDEISNFNCSFHKVSDSPNLIARTEQKIKDCLEHSISKAYLILDKMKNEITLQGTSTMRMKSIDANSIEKITLSYVKRSKEMEMLELKINTCLVHAIESFLKHVNTRIDYSKKPNYKS
ncbi:uncharacterized protein LOC123680618 [Harmonia axyridis]|uniref:uncharacterized protein LOC123680618 n=1 Tax=Harmonia axyridis TaxID=115357 RepID=UPI001E277B50|nr:uncharacterized protein LOC123680618 [Harmonia axyridis]